ncbi:CU044_5270 family protein [Nonomuraea sp. 3N208]|uniref:CU044_5270 family protein n=1 Tax=Nonomuraea sp. 3N208 TaxID=3457421 RepID=UPI003FCC86D5
MDELRLLKDRHDALPGPDESTVAESRSRLLAHMHRAPARRLGMRWALGLAGAAAVTLAAAIVIVPGGGEGSESPQARPSSSHPSSTPLRLRKVAGADDLAGNAAALAAANPDPVPEPDQWAYIKTEESGEKGTRVHEMWRRADEKQFAHMEDGKLEVFDGSEFEVTYPYLLSLPTEPAALLARVYEEIDAEHAKRQADRGRTRATVPPLTAEQRHTYAFQHIVQGMRDAVLPRTLRAAMYGALAGIPGVRYEARATDLAKRPGVTLYRIHEGYLRDEIFIDPKTYEYLGYRSVVVRDKKDARTYFSVTKGQILGWGSMLAGGVVDRPGERP